MQKVTLIDAESYKELLNKIQEINQKLTAIQKPETTKNQWLTNEEACKKLNVSSRTMQNYRDKGVLGFSQYAGKLYYRNEDLEEHLNSHYHKAFNRDRRTLS